MAAILAALWVSTDDWLIWVGTHALVNGFLGPVVFFSLWAFSRGSNTLCTLAGFLFGLAIYIRADGLLLFGAHLIGFLDIHRLKFQQPLFFVGMAMGVVLGGGVDMYFYGVWFVSPWNWFLFNVWEGHAGSTFGTMPPDFYWNKLVLERPLFIGGLALSAAVFVLRLAFVLFVPRVQGGVPVVSKLRCSTSPSCPVEVSSGDSVSDPILHLLQGELGSEAHSTLAAGGGVDGCILYAGPEISLYVGFGVVLSSHWVGMRLRLRIHWCRHTRRSVLPTISLWCWWSSFLFTWRTASTLSRVILRHKPTDTPSETYFRFSCPLSHFFPLQAVFVTCAIFVAMAGVISCFERESWRHSDG